MQWKNHFTSGLTILPRQFDHFAQRGYHVYHLLTQKSHLTGLERPVHAAYPPRFRFHWFHFCLKFRKWTKNNSSPVTFTKKVFFILITWLWPSLITRWKRTHCFHWFCSLLLSGAATQFMRHKAQSNMPTQLALTPQDNTACYTCSKPADGAVHHDCRKGKPCLVGVF